MVRVESPRTVDFVLEGIADFVFSIWIARYISEMNIISIIHMNQSKYAYTINSGQAYSLT